MDAEPIAFGRCPAGGFCPGCPIRDKCLSTYYVASRRRGISIGINPFPGRKVCSMDCVYCFRGKTEVLEAGPVDLPSALSVEGLRRSLEVASRVGRVDSIDFSGRGEPTLHPRFPELVDVALEFSRGNGQASVGLFTNATYCGEGVLRAVSKLDRIEAKLDSAIPWKFEALDRPHESIGLQRVLECLRVLRRSSRGTFVIQVMLLRYGGIENFGREDALAMANALRGVRPDAVDVYTAYRRPRSDEVSRASEGEVVEFARALEGEGLEVRVYPT